MFNIRSRKQSILGVVRKKKCFCVITNLLKKLYTRGALLMCARVCVCLSVCMYVCTLSKYCNNHTRIETRQLEVFNLVTLKLFLFSFTLEIRKLERFRVVTKVDCPNTGYVDEC